MKSFLDTDQYTSTRNNTYTGQPQRQWIEYADGVFEPVRKNGNLNRKYHGNKRELDWWTVDKPLDWDPVEEGRDVSLNHDYGQKNKPGKKLDRSIVPTRPRHDADGRQTMELRPEDLEKAKPEPLLQRRDEKPQYQLIAAADEKKKPEEEDQPVPSQPEPPARPEGGEEENKESPKTTLLRGAEAYHEFEAERKAQEEAEAIAKDMDPRPDVHRGEVIGRAETKRVKSPDLYGDKPEWWQLAQASRASGHRGDGNLVFVDNVNKAGSYKRGEYAGHRISNDKVKFENDQPKNPSPDQPVQKELSDLVDKMMDKKSGVRGLESININSTVGGKHSKNSRHYKGGAIDINRVNGKPVSELSNKEVEAINKWLVRNGYGPGDGWESLNPKTDSKKHQDHFHIGMQNRDGTPGSLNSKWRPYKK